MRTTSNKDKATSDGQPQALEGKPSASTEDPQQAPKTSVSSTQGSSPQPSVTSSPTLSNAPAALDPLQVEPIRKKEKKLNLQSRPRPQGAASNPFTRHTSLRYRSQPLSLQPLRPGKYEVLADESVVPRLPPEEPPSNKPTDIDALLSLSDPPAPNNPQGITTTNNGGVQWSSGGKNAAGLLITPQNNLNQQKQSNPFQVNGDDFSNLANRHQTSAGVGTNPFNVEEPVRWL